MSQQLPREKGSSPHNPLDPACAQYAGEVDPAAMCLVCASRRQAREQARHFLDHAVREKGS